MSALPRLGAAAARLPASVLVSIAALCIVPAMAAVALNAARGEGESSSAGVGGSAYAAEFDMPGFDAPLDAAPESPPVRNSPHGGVAAGSRGMVFNAPPLADATAFWNPPLAQGALSAQSSSLPGLGTSNAPQALWAGTPLQPGVLLGGATPGGGGGAIARPVIPSVTRTVTPTTDSTAPGGDPGPIFFFPPGFLPGGGDSGGGLGAGGTGESSGGIGGSDGAGGSGSSGGGGSSGGAPDGGLVIGDDGGFGAPSEVPLPSSLVLLLLGLFGFAFFLSHKALATRTR